MRTIAVVAFCGLVVAFVGSAVVPATAWVWISVVSALLLLPPFCERFPFAMVMAAPMVVLRITELVSGVAIENGAFMTEVNELGSATGAFTRLSLLYACFFWIVGIVVDRNSETAKFSEPSIDDRRTRHAGLLVLTVAMGMIAYLFLIGMREGFPLVEGIDRFRFRRELEDPILVSVISNRLICVYCLGIVLLLKEFRWRAAGVFVVLFCVSILYSEKFTSLIVLGFSFITPAALYHINRTRRFPSRLVVGVLAAVLSISAPVVLVVYGGLDDPARGAEKFVNRATGQGEVWYMTERKFSSRLFSFDATALTSDVLSWTGVVSQSPEDVGSDFGLYYVMREIASPAAVSDNIKTGNGFVFCLLSYWLIAFGWLGVIFGNVLSALYFGWVLRQLRDAIMEYDWVACIIISKLLNFLYSAFFAGYMWDFFGYKPVFAICLLFAWRRWMRHDKTYEARLLN